MVRFLQSLWSLVVFLFFPVAFYAPHGMVVLFLCLGGAGLLAIGRAKRPFFEKGFGVRWVASLTLLLHVWMGLSLFWTLHFRDGLSVFLSVSALNILGLTLLFRRAYEDLPSRVQMRRALLGGLGLTLALLTFELATDTALAVFLKGDRAGTSNLNYFSRGASLLAILSLPMVAALKSFRWGRVMGAGALIATVFILLHLESHAAIAGIFVGGGVWLVSAVSPRLIAWGLSGVILVFFLGMPLVSHTILAPDVLADYATYLPKDSYQHRACVHYYFKEQALTHPFRGWGVNAARSKTFHIPNYWAEQSTLGPRQKKLAKLCQWNAGENHILHPHHAGLQAWVELGLPGALLLAILLMLLPHVALRDFPDASQQRLILAMFSTTLVIAMISFGLWQNWWIASLWMSLLIIRHIVKESPEGQQKSLLESYKK